MVCAVILHATGALLAFAPFVLFSIAGVLYTDYVDPTALVITGLLAIAPVTVVCVGASRRSGGLWAIIVEAFVAAAVAGTFVPGSDISPLSAWMALAAVLLIASAACAAVVLRRRARPQGPPLTLAERRSIASQTDPAHFSAGMGNKTSGMRG